MVQTGEPIDLGIVSQCDVMNCTYNEGQRCIAGAIDVTFLDDLAQCYTYTTEEPSSSVQVARGAGDVSQCDLIDCTYNEGQRCIADSITVNLLDSVAQCATYTTTSSGATG
jgi:hypothetical protein